QVAGLEVAVNEPAGGPNVPIGELNVGDLGLVGVGQGVEHLEGQPDRVGYVQGAAAAAQDLPDAAAGAVFHREEEGGAVTAAVERLDDVRVPQGRHVVDLAEESAAHILVDGEVGVHELEGHPPPGRDVPGQVHHAHPAARQLAVDLVGTQRPRIARVDV